MEKEEKKIVAIVFADISGFTKLSAELDPDEVGEVANITFGELDSIIIKHGGKIDKHQGDLVMAIFGIPKSFENNAERAIKASIAMLNSMQKINKKISSAINKKMNLSLHIGINMGEVAFTKVGSSHKIEYTVMGNAVNLASRICNFAKKGEIIVSEQVFNQTNYLFDYEILKPVELKGISDKVKLFKVIKIKKEPEERRIRSVLVGRDLELNTLKECIEKNKNVFIAGAPGVGKSRLVAEVKKITNIPWLEGNCPSYDSSSYAPFVEIIRKVYNIGAYDKKEEIEEKIIKKTKDIIPEKEEEIIPYVGHLCGVNLMEEKVKYLSTQDLKLQIFLMTRSLLNKIVLW